MTNHFVGIREIETLSENWYTLQKVTFEQVRRDGRHQVVAREVYYNGPGAAVLPIDGERGTVLLVRQFRIPVHMNGDSPMLIEACAGMVESGEDPAEAVRKELEQETGYRGRDLRKVFELYMSPGASAEKLYLFTADYTPADNVGRGGGLEKEGEQIEVVELPLARAWEMVGAGEIVDAKTVLLLQHARLNEREIGPAGPLWRKPGEDEIVVPDGGRPRPAPTADSRPAGKRQKAARRRQHRQVQRPATGRSI